MPRSVTPRMASSARCWGRHAHSHRRPCLAAVLVLLSVHGADAQASQQAAAEHRWQQPPHLNETAVAALEAAYVARAVRSHAVARAREAAVAPPPSPAAPAAMRMTVSYQLGALAAAPAFVAAQVDILPAAVKTLQKLFKVKFRPVGTALPTCLAACPTP